MYIVSTSSPFRTLFNSQQYHNQLSHKGVITVIAINCHPLLFIDVINYPSESIIVEYNRWYSTHQFILIIAIVKLI